jgi:pimeloyl-ACP methyl ester carboxylesterase
MPAQFAISPDGTRIAYDVIGHGPALMLLHGAGKTRQDWRKVGYVERLKDDFTVVSIDLRGTGDSDFKVEISDYAIENLCADVNAVADACGLQRYLIWGYSFGGNIARYLGAWSERVIAMAVIGVPLDQAVDVEFDKYIDVFIEKWGPLANAYRAGALGADKQKSAIKGRMPVWVACFQAMRGWPSIDLRNLRCPTLLLTGSENKTAFNWVQSNSDLLREAEVKVEIVPGLNHPQEFSQIERVFPQVSSFLKEYAAQG